ncbi:hypothetical protein HPB47_001368 [Ixodes persulcatus]|uniref:Uncharacterized protein n=1 Tax=Ixodes persulcatus TaxID=34615 RepID=A0AC60PQS4_IXOPE|nr:hypothetical protein HPB47_001368 [Ixodes persulcatus]
MKGPGKVAPRRTERAGLPVGEPCPAATALGRSSDRRTHPAPVSQSGTPSYGARVSDWGPAHSSQRSRGQMTSQKPACHVAGCRDPGGWGATSPGEK